MYHFVVFLLLFFSHIVLFVTFLTSNSEILYFILLLCLRWNYLLFCMLNYHCSKLVQQIFGDKSTFLEERNTYSYIINRYINFFLTSTRITRQSIKQKLGAQSNKGLVFWITIAQFVFVIIHVFLFIKH